MSPKTLNVEKLEKKFASLTKSRESILGLSTWIIRHKEFYKEIVDHWLDALSKGIVPKILVIVYYYCLSLLHYRVTNILCQLL